MFKACIISCGMIANSAHIPAYRRFADVTVKSTEIPNDTADLIISMIK